MEKKVFPLILGISIVLLAVAVLLPTRAPDEHPKLPWDIRANADGSSTVFELTLGRSTLADARQVLQDSADVNIFIAEDGTRALEGYFQNIYLSGLRASFIVTLDLSPDAMEAMYHRGARVSTLDSGVKKVELSSQDLVAVEGLPIAHLTYLPGANLDPEVISARFGEPERRIEESPGLTHWLYPAKGLDILVDDKAKEVLQYVSPARFDSILAPLEQKKASPQQAPADSGAPAAATGTATGTGTGMQ